MMFSCLKDNWIDGRTKYRQRSTKQLDQYRPYFKVIVCRYRFPPNLVGVRLEYRQKNRQKIGKNRHKIG